MLLYVGGLFLVDKVCSSGQRGVCALVGERSTLFWFIIGGDCHLRVCLCLFSFVCLVAQTTVDSNAVDKFGNFTKAILQVFGLLMEVTAYADISKVWPAAFCLLQSLQLCCFSCCSPHIQGTLTV